MYMYIRVHLHMFCTCMYTWLQSESGELGSVRGEAVKEAVEFNRRLAEQRRQLRSSFFDRHTQVHVQYMY